MFVRIKSLPIRNTVYSVHIVIHKDKNKSKFQKFGRSVTGPIYLASPP